MRRTRVVARIDSARASSSLFTIASVRSAAERRELLKELYEQARGCVRCPLHITRTSVVFGAGNADAELMFVGEAPGASEDRVGLPFVGQAGKLLERLLGEIGMERADVWICNVLKCRPPDNRDPHPNEITACQDYLRRQVDLIEPNVICTLGNFATKLLREDMTGISRLHGREEERLIGPRIVRLYPLYHPAAALYTPSMLETLRADFTRIPQLLALGSPAQAFKPEAETVPATEKVSATNEVPATEEVPAPDGVPAPDDPATGDLPRIDVGKLAVQAAERTVPGPEPAAQLGLF